MIYFVKGILDSVYENQVIVENQGIGYRVMVPMSAAAALPQPGTEVKLYTYMYVREDAVMLYGFPARNELEMFKMLVNVSGIGPKGALGILSVMDVDALRFAILADDAKSIAKAPGVGVKTAGRLILELKDKIDFEDAVESALDRGEAASAAVGAIESEAVTALEALGFTRTEAVQAVRAVSVTPDMAVEDILKASLKKI